MTGGFFSVPLTDGGAVEALVQSIVDENEKRRELDLLSIVATIPIPRLLLGLTGTRSSDS